MNINHLISIGLYISGIVVYAMYKRYDYETIINTELREECDKQALPEVLWPFVVFIMTIVYIILCCVWPLWTMQDLWKFTKAAFKKT